MIHTFAELVGAVKQMEKKTIVAVVEAHDEHTIESVVQAKNDGIMLPLLIGDKDAIAGMLIKLGQDIAAYTLLPSDSQEQSLMEAVKLVNQGKANAIMKGKLESNIFLKGIINKDNRLTTNRRLSLVGFYQAPKYHKLFAVSDMGLNIYPDISGKRDILLNAVQALHAMGVETPKVAVMAAVEKLSPNMPETVDADALKQMNASGEITGCIVEGPISFDLATSEKAAVIKGYKSPVAGDADLLLVPDITSGNMLVKCLTGFAGAKTAGMLMGAKVPVIFTSRSAEASDKYYSIAIAAYTAARL